jgi:phosphoglycolate phosphatase
VQFKAVIFDLDGTLLDTLEDIADAMNSVLAEDGFPTHALESYRTFVGDGVRTLARRTLPETQRDEKSVDRFTARMRAAYARNWNAKTTPYPGVPEMLDAIAERDLKIAILSNKPDDFTRLCVEELLPKWRFDVVAGHRDGIPLKPEPGGAVAVASQLGFPPAEILYVGDSGMDMQTAVGAGMTPVGVLWGFRSRKELLDAGAAALAVVPSDVVSFLDRPR